MKKLLQFFDSSSDSTEDESPEKIAQKTWAKLNTQNIF